MSVELLEASRASILAIYGVLPSWTNPATTGALVKEAQRHLAQWQIRPIENLIAHEASEKLGQSVKLDGMQPLQAFDSGNRARTVNAIVQALALAKQSGVDPDQVMKLVNWGPELTE